MPIPPFVTALRRRVGHDLLWLPGVTAVVVRGADAGPEVLLVRRADNGSWTPVTGIVDPGEDPHVTAVREVLEEASVVAEVERLVWVAAGDVVTHPNGDRAQYLDHTFRCAWVSGEPVPGDDECTDAGWFAPHALPQMPERHRVRVEWALADEPGVRLGSGDVAARR
ncbi:MAG TPA: NUDIX domain-containing protein [Intrasporangium sp.]|uniref:NUDIX hydrolase n=1 Tax=Intrasporangium sp. TaxID=1925024 RepID=UPI002D77A6DA|nr:NUDIX domain-containing protein [Intrasporangium sp.]HET7398872.1 NUDIX domain-containing protein [Intrasporangium sp.]